MQLFKPKYRVEECLDALRPVLESGWTGSGSNCKGFEEDWNEFTGARFSHYVNSCTAALHLAVRLLDLPKGTKVCTTGLTFVSTNAVLLYEGLTPLFCDINPDTLSLSAEDVKLKCIGEDAKAVIWVHYGGMVDDGFYSFMEWANQRGIRVIEDCAHAGGAFYKDGSRVGSRKDTISCFSFQAVKNLPTFDGGLISVPTEEELTRVKKLAWLGIDKDTFARTNSSNNEVYKWQYDVPELGWKYNGNDVSASIARVGLKYLDADNAYRARILEWYKKLIGGGSGSLLEHTKGSSNHLVVYKTKRRDELISRLKLCNIAPGVHYLPNMNFAPFKKYYNKFSCKVTESASDCIVSLPNHLSLTYKDVERVCGVINDC